MKLQKITLKILCALLVFSGTTLARSLAEYKEAITHIRGDLTELIYPEEDSTEADNLEFEEIFFGELPELLPAREKIEIQGATVETNNGWFYEKIEKYKKSGTDNSESANERNLILNDIYERLTAVELEIEKLEATSAGEVTKDANKRKLSEILSREEYAKPQPPEEGIFQKTLRKIKEWLRKMFPQTDIQPGSAFEGLGTLGEVLKFLLYALIIGAIGFVIYKFLPLFLDKYKSREKREKKDRVILGEKLSSDATAQSLFGDAENLAKQGDLRGAIRKGYIALLCELDDRKIVRLSKDKTNRDYLRDVRGRSGLYSEMNDLTNNFERHWYGFEDANETDWEEFRSGYKKAVVESN